VLCGARDTKLLCHCAPRAKEPHPYYTLQFHKCIHCTFPTSHTEHDVISYHKFIFIPWILTELRAPYVYENIYLRSQEVKSV
jgi:hypothetical protein